LPQPGERFEGVGSHSTTLRHETRLGQQCSCRHGHARHTERISTWIDNWRSQTQLEFAARFEAWGASDASGWASSELEEDIAQSARYLLLRAVWRRMNEALDEAMDEGLTTELRQAGISESDIADVSRRTRSPDMCATIRSTSAHAVAMPLLSRP
jgi:hypothetical protein